MRIVVCVFFALAAAAMLVSADPEQDRILSFNVDGVPTKCYHIGWERYPNAQGGYTQFNPLDKIADQYESWGLKVRLEPICNTGTPACTASISHGYVIFDSTAQSTTDRDLNTPNENCADFNGPKFGHAGDAESAELAKVLTCSPLGKIAVIQNAFRTTPADDSEFGGRVVLNFDRPVTVRAIGLLDIEKSEAVRGADVLWYTGPPNNPNILLGGFNVTEPLGDNVYRLFRFQSPPVVRRVRVDFPGSGSLTDLVYCENDGDVPCGTFGGEDCCEAGRYCHRQTARNPTGKSVCLDPANFVSKDTC